MQSSVLSVRISTSERDILETAATNMHTNVSDFVRRKALEAAEMDVLERKVVTIPAKDWEKFESWVDSPAQEVSALKELSGIRPTWQK